MFHRLTLAVRPDPTATILPMLHAKRRQLQSLSGFLYYLSGNMCNCRFKGHRTNFLVTLANNRMDVFKFSGHKKMKSVEDSVFVTFFRPVLAYFLPNLKCSVFTEQ